MMINLKALERRIVGDHRRRARFREAQKQAGDLIFLDHIKALAVQLLHLDAGGFHRTKEHGISSPPRRLVGASGIRIVPPDLR